MQPPLFQLPSTDGEGKITTPYAQSTPTRAHARLRRHRLRGNRGGRVEWRAPGRARDNLDPRPSWTRLGSAAHFYTRTASSGQCWSVITFDRRKGTERETGPPTSTQHCRGYCNDDGSDTKAPVTGNTKLSAGGVRGGTVHPRLVRALTRLPSAAPSARPTRALGLISLQILEGSRCLASLSSAVKLPSCVHGSIWAWPATILSWAPKSLGHHAWYHVICTRNSTWLLPAISAATGSTTRWTIINRTPGKRADERPLRGPEEQTPAAMVACSVPARMGSPVQYSPGCELFVLVINLILMTCMAKTCIPPRANLVLTDSAPAPTAAHHPSPMVTAKPKAHEA